MELPRARPPAESAPSPPQRYNGRQVPQSESMTARSTKEKRRRLSTPPPSFADKRFLAEAVRNVVEGRVQLVADALHRSNSGNGDQRGNQAVLNRGRTLRIFDQLNELHHLRSPDRTTPRLRTSIVCRTGGISLKSVYQSLKPKGAT